ncbi:AAA family ATPase [Micromonospora tulbaghiae]|uniref:AAA family ATPase n=1 Tax=Micromonospora tulbaghiae TaxID=479978 RepID=UPI0033E2049E
MKDGATWLHFEDAECWLNFRGGTASCRWSQTPQASAVLAADSLEDALDRLEALEGMDVWRVVSALRVSTDPRDLDYDRWRKLAQGLLEKRHHGRALLPRFIATHDQALGLAARPGGGVNFTCPECGGPAAALGGDGLRVTHTLKSGLVPEDWSGSCPLTGRYGPDIDVSMLPTNPPARVASGPIPLAGALSLDEEDSEEDLDWLVEGIVARGDYVSLFGPSGVGKSLLVLDWSLRMARRGARVLYLDKENPKRAIRARLRAMGATPEDMERLAVMPFVDLPDLATPTGAQALADMAHQHCADVVVLDTISKFSQVGQATQTDRWTTMYNISFTPLLAGGTAVIQLDHTGLSNRDRERDSGAKRDNVSVAYGLMPAARAGGLTLTRVKNRLNYPGDDAITLQRVTEPVLTHTTGERVDPKILAALRELEKAEVPLTAGRDAARAKLPEGVSISNDVLAAAIRLRKAELEG